jgi:hypothetical protein
MRITFEVGVLLLASAGLVYVLLLLGKVLSASSARLQELKSLQGDARHILKGTLAHPPQSCDYRVVQGLEWDGKRYVAQSRLSTESVRAAFFN